MSIDSNRSDPDQALVATRLGFALARALADDERPLAPDVQSRLRFARERALERARAARRPASPVVQASGSALVLGRRLLGWSTLAPWIAAAALALGFMLVGDWQQRERAQVAAEVDALLLSDQLPPAAYADPGFVAFLKLSQP